MPLHWIRGLGMGFPLYPMIQPKICFCLCPLLLLTLSMELPIPLILEMQVSG